MKLKWWQIVWLAVFGIWGNVVFVAAAIDLVQGDALDDVVGFCLQMFTLPAASTYAFCAFLDWAARRHRREMSGRARPSLLAKFRRPATS